MRTVAKLVILIVFSLQMPCPHGEAVCKNVKGTCEFHDRKDDYSLKIESINCTNSTHLSIYFSYNIDPFYIPKGIAIYLDNWSGDEFAHKRFEKPSSNFENLTVKKQLMPKDPQMSLRFAFLHPHCKNTRYSSPIDVHILVTCVLPLFSCPKPVATTVISTATTKLVNLKETKLKEKHFIPTSNAKNNNITSTIFISCATFAFFGFIGTMLICFMRKNHHKAARTSCSEKFISPDDVAAVDSLNKVNVSVKLFIIFNADHQKHLNVVKNFALFLQGDLGFEVSCEIFQTLEYSQDPVTWMDKSFNDADKVLVIWSRNAVSRWMHYNKEESGYQDLFTPVLKHIHKDLFRHRNREKYYFGFFDYFAKENIPHEFINETNFRLMDQFEDLYYRLKSIEPYVPGGEIREEKVMKEHYSSFEHNLYGHNLHLAIAEMNQFALDSPERYSQQRDVESFIFDSIVKDEVRESVLCIEPPSPIRHHNFEKENFSRSDSAVQVSTKKTFDCSGISNHAFLSPIIQHDKASALVEGDKSKNMHHASELFNSSPIAENVIGNTKHNRVKLEYEKLNRPSKPSCELDSVVCFDRQVIRTNAAANSKPNAASTNKNVMTNEHAKISNPSEISIQDVNGFFLDKTFKINNQKLTPLPEVTLASMDLNNDPMASLVALNQKRANELRNRPKQPEL